MGKGGSGGGPPRPDAPAEEDKKEEAIPAKFQLYLTIDEDLRDMLVRMRNVPEKSTDKVLFQSALSLSEQAARSDFKQMWDITQWFPHAPANVAVVGSGFLIKNDTTYAFRSGIQCDKAESAVALGNELHTVIGPDFAKVFTDLTGIKIEMTKDDTKKTDGGGPRYGPPVGPNGPMGPMMPPPRGGGGGLGPMPPRGGSGGGPFGPAGGRGGKGGSGQGPPKGNMGPMGGGPMMPQGPPNMGNMMPPNMGRNQQGGAADLEEDEDEEDVSGIVVRQAGKRILFRVKVAMTSEEKIRMEKLAGLVLHGLRGDLDSFAQAARLHRLGAAVKALGTSSDQKFPKAALYRRPAPVRANYNWEPDQRISWMAELLPYLGQQSLYQNIDKTRAFSDNQNVLAARCLVPEFIDPSYDTASHYVSYPGVRLNVATTHFVGIAGVGEDSADDTDLNGADIGVLGYERQMPFATVNKRGASNTAVMIQVPPDQAGPWMAGGGSTVRGIPASGSIKPFVVPHLGGTHVLMADGSVRFVKETVSDDVFKSMGRANGPVVGKKKPDDWTDVKPEPQPVEAAPAPAPAPMVPVKPEDKPAAPNK
jgi:prepilin-type processing-associated H-X9-DG protein